MGQDVLIVLYGQNTTAGVLPHATRRFDSYVLCYSSFVISYAKIKLYKENFFIFFKTTFLRTEFSSHCLWDKGRFAAHSKRRLAPAMEQDAHPNVKESMVVHRIVLWFYCHFLIERNEHCSTQNT